VQSYQIFTANSEDLNHVSCSSPNNQGKIDKYKVTFKKDRPLSQELLNIPMVGFVPEKQFDFYKNIRAFVPEKVSLRTLS